MTPDRGLGTTPGVEAGKMDTPVIEKPDIDSFSGIARKDCGNGSRLPNRDDSGKGEVMAMRREVDSGSRVAARDDNYL